MSRKIKQEILSLEVARVVRNVSIGVSAAFLVSFWIFCKIVEL